MLTIKRNERIHTVYCGNKIIAHIFLDYLYQVRTIAFHTRDQKQRRKIKELVLSHAIQFLRRREHNAFGGLMICSVENRYLTDGDSHRLMDFSCTPAVVKELSDKALDENLENYVDAVEAIYPDAFYLIDRALRILRSAYGASVSCRLTKTERWLADENRLVTFTVEGDHRFKLWKDVRLPTNDNHNWFFHIIPPYHPLAQGQGCSEVLLINGNNDWIIRGSKVGLGHIFRPFDSPDEEPTTKDLFGSFSSSPHPFYCEGHCLTIEISLSKLVSKSALKQLIKLLAGALNLGKQYIGVSGGFNSPFTMAWNLTRHPEFQMPAGAKDRGSEHNVMWEYEVLKAEGRLEGAIIPKWFLDENWPELYKKYGQKQ